MCVCVCSVSIEEVIPNDTEYIKYKTQTISFQYKHFCAKVFRNHPLKDRWLTIRHGLPVNEYAMIPPHRTNPYCLFADFRLSLSLKLIMEVR